MKSALSWAVASPLGFVLEGIDGGARQGRDPGMGEKNAFLRDGKEAMAKRFVRQNMVDAEIDVVCMLLHHTSFAQIWEKASP